MTLELFARICVGAPLTPEAAVDLHREFVRALGLADDATAAQLFEHLRADVPRHKLHEPDRVRYERALEAFVDARWDADMALGGLSPEGVLEPRRGFLFVGVRVEQFELTLADAPRRGEPVERPQWLRKGDLTRGSDLARALGPDVRKPFEHACTAYSRAAKEILADAVGRVSKLPVVKQHEPDWALCRWLVDADHDSAQHRHGRAQRK